MVTIVDFKRYAKRIKGGISDLIMNIKANPANLNETDEQVRRMAQNLLAEIEPALNPDDFSALWMEPGMLHLSKELLSEIIMLREGR